MRWSVHLLIICLCCFAQSSLAQDPCSIVGDRGQTPATAFPVCGVDTFFQSTVHICQNKVLPVPGCENTGVVYGDKNPFWYKFTCFTAGTLSFVITPNDLGDDYDWQLFDVTGHTPDDVYTDQSLFVVGNWSGSYGLTGASTTGTGNIQCASLPTDNIPTFSQSPLLIQGHEYLLMVSHYTDSQSGYGLSFGGGTASITDPTDPLMQSAETSCDGSQIRLKLNKAMKCITVAANGSDFIVQGATAKIVSATAIGCSDDYNTDSIILSLESPLAPGNYKLAAVNGTDSNTVKDNCDRSIPENSTVDFVIYGRQPTPLDSIAPVACAPGVLQLVFSKNIQCSSIAANGSDFQVTGPHAVVVASADGSCSGGLTKIINIRLASPVTDEGTYTIKLVAGSDSSTITDECGEVTPAGATISFSVKDTVSANFTYQLVEGCRADTIYYSNKGGNGITQWNWTFDNTSTFNSQNAVMYYNSFGNKTAQLIVTNGFCSDTSMQNIYLNHDTLDAAFTGPSVYCPNELATFRDTSRGTIVFWYWEFGNGNTSTLQNPPAQYYPPVDMERTYPVRLIVSSDKNCTDTALHYIKDVNNCYIAVPTAFTPNHDGRNDYLYPLNAYKASNLQFRVFNRYGQLIFQTQDWTRKWDGRYNGIDQASGVYVWILEYTDTETGKKISQKGTTVLIR